MTTINLLLPFPVIYQAGGKGGAAILLGWWNVCRGKIQSVFFQGYFCTWNDEYVSFPIPSLTLQDAETPLQSEFFRSSIKFCLHRSEWKSLWSPGKANTRAFPTWGMLGFYFSWTILIIWDVLPNWDGAMWWGVRTTHGAVSAFSRHFCSAGHVPQQCPTGWAEQPWCMQGKWGKETLAQREKSWKADKSFVSHMHCSARHTQSRQMMDGAEWIPALPYLAISLC